MMSEPTPKPFFFAHEVLAICVQVVTLAGAFCFVIAIWLNSAVFSRWNLNFLQLATTGDVVNSGLDIVSRMAIPLFLVGAACVIAWRWPVRRRSAYIALLLLGFGAYGVSAWAQHILDGNIAQLQSLLARPAADDVPLDPGNLAAHVERMTAESERWMAESERRAAAIQDLSSRSEWPQWVRNWSWVVSQMAIAFLSVSVLGGVARGAFAAGWPTWGKTMLAVGAGASVFVVPFSAFLEVRAELVSGGFHRDHVVVADCDPGPRFEAADLFWLGDRAMVLRCMSGMRVVIHEGGTVLGDRWSLDPAIRAAEEAGERADELARDDGFANAMGTDADRLDNPPPR